MSEQSPLSGRAISLVRYLDVSVVLAVLPVFALGDLPFLGYAIGAVAWLGTRYGVDLVLRRARTIGNPAKQTALLFSSMMGRVFAIVAAILIARFAGNTDDGIAAAAIVLVAFTVQLLVALATRGGAYGARPRGSS
jgi:hypothetical protein